MSWLKNVFQGSTVVYHGFFSMSWAKNYYSFYTMRQPNGKLIHITHVVDLKNEAARFETLPDDAVFVGDVESEIIRSTEQNVRDRVIPIVNGRPIENFYDDYKSNFS